MAKSKSSGTSEAQEFKRDTGTSNGAATAATRIDPPHEVNSAEAEPSAVAQSAVAQPAPIDVTPERIRLQADQLAGHLRDRQGQLDHREAELNSRAARLESDARAARLWLSEREADLADRDESLVQRQGQIEKQLKEMDAAEAGRQTVASASLAEKEEELRRTAEELATQKQRLDEARSESCAAQVEAGRQTVASASLAEKEEELRRTADELAAQKQRLDEAEERVSGAQAEAERFQKQLTQQQQKSEEEIAALREQMVAEHQLAMAELAQKRQAVERRADHVDQCQATLKQLRGELGRMHRETLEIRLATEELWVQLAGAAPPAALTRSLGRIRSKLADQYHQEEAGLAEQKKELEAIRNQLVEQHAALVQQKRRFEQWAVSRQDELQRQTSRLVAREQQLHREEVQHVQQSQCWQTERMKCHQELRRLRVELGAHEETAVPA